MDNDFKMSEIFNGDGVIFERKNSEESNKAVIIIDDEWEGAQLSFEQAISHPRPTTKTMAAIKSALHEIDSVKKIVFLTLPEKKGDIAHWDDFFGNYVNELNCKWVYILVDIYFGGAFTEDEKVGVDLMKYLEKKYKGFKLAFLSIAGFAGRGEYEGKKIFEKGQVTGFYQQTRQLLPSILEWLEESHPLDILWGNTKDWFSIVDSPGNFKLIENNPAEVNRLHSFYNSWWERRDLKENYKSNINNALKVDIPDEWYENSKSVEILHDSLKNLCGSYYCGTPIVESKYNLTIGAVYLIAILAMRDAGNYYDLTKEYKGSTFLMQKYKILRSKFLPRQSEDDAKNTAKALYTVFYNFFIKDGKHNQNVLNENGLRQFAILDDGKKLKFTFEWSATQESGLAEQFKKTPKPLSDQQKNNSATLAGSIQSLFVNMNRTTVGFGSPGTIWMEDKDLYVASANSPARVLIVCSDSSDGRGKKWAELFLNTEVSEVYVAKNSGEIILYRHNIDDCRTIEIKDFPQTFVCVMVHQGDSGLWDNLKNDYKLQFNKLFRFSGPGIYNTADGLPIMRITSADFDITVKDVIEVVDYSSGKRKETPAICKPKPAKEVLSAISIFCLGYLMAGVAGGKIDTKDVDDVKLLIGWNDQIKDTFPALLESGWEKAKNPKWWFSEEQIKYLKEYANRDMGEHPFPKVEKLIGYIVKGNDIEDYKVIKEAFKELVEMGKKG